MTSILRDWLTKYNIEWEREKRLEDVFSNGYLIGQLLSNLEIGGLNQELFDSEFINDVSIETITSNYKLVTKYLIDGGINIKPKLLQDIANNVNGAIHRFIYDLKCFMDRVDIESKSNSYNDLSLINTKTLNEGTSSFKSPPRISSPTRIRKPLYEDMQKRDIELKIRKLATTQFHKRSELKWQKYKDFQIENEKKAKIDAEFEKQLKAERVSQRHDILVKTLKTHHNDAIKADKVSKEKWIINQKIKKKRENEKLYFQKTQKLKQIQKIHRKKAVNSNDFESCIDEFENILNKSQKLQKSESQEITASTSELNAKSKKSDDNKENKNKNSGSNSKDENNENINYDEPIEILKDDPLEHLEKLRRRLPDKTVSMQKTEEYLSKIKVNVARQKQESLQREQRRKQLIADEVALHLKNEKLDREKEINDIINEPSKATKSFDEKIKTIKLHKKIFKQNAEFIKQKEIERKENDEIIKLHRDREHFEIRKVEFKTKVTIQARKLKELRMKQQQHQHVENKKYCKKLVKSIIDITYKSVLYRKLSDQEQVPKPLFSEWMGLLNVDKNIKSEHILTNIDDDKKISDLTQTLEKEKECHTNIQQIQNGLIDCMDINGSFNKLLINETELDNYLNAKGIWTYNNNDNTASESKLESVSTQKIEEPSNNNLGAIIEEIISVSEGPDPRYQRIIPEVPISIVFIGKPFVGKSTQAQQIADKYALQIINPEASIKEAMAAFEAFKSKQESESNPTETENDDQQQPEMTMTEQQKIGQRLKESLENGQEVNDEIYIDTIFNAILSVKDDEKTNGWILDGFPIRRSQAELLEAKLTGYVDTPAPKTGKPSKKKPSKVAPPIEKDPADIPKIPSGLDFVFYLDVDADDIKEKQAEDEEPKDIHEILLNRAEGRLVDEESGRVYHITENPPPSDQAIKEKLKSPPDQEYVAALPEHFKAFDERKQNIKEWFDKFGTWIELNCNQDRKILTQSLIQMIKEKIENKQAKEEQEKLNQQQQQNEEDVQAEPEMETETDAKNEDGDDANKADDKDEDTDKDGEKAVDAEIVQDEKEEVVVAMPWDEHIKDQNMCRRLHYFWNNVEQSYIDDMSNTFELLRHERRRILAYLASTREYFYNFLRRTDGKQKMIDHFQTEYNKIHPDMRRDDDTKEELHQRVQELSFQLFEYSMKRKNEGIEELDTIKNSVWLITENNTLLKVMIGIIQYELNRYISTIRVIKDYFKLKNNESISEDSTQSIDLFAIIEEQVNANEGVKKGKDKKNIKDNSDNSLNEMNFILDKLQNGVDLALQHIIEPQENENQNQNENENENEEETTFQFVQLQNDIIRDENERLKMRLTRLSTILSYYLQDVNDRHINLMEKLDKWIGLRIESENSAIDSLVNHIQISIENESELNFRLILEGENFLIDQDVIVCPMPNPIQRKPSNHQFSTKGAFTAAQIKQLIELLGSQNANGIIEYKSMAEILKRLSNNSYAQNEPILPLLWNNLAEPQIYILLSPFVIPYNWNRYINWKLFIVSIMLQTLSIINNTVTIPSLDTLFDLKQAFNAKDTEKSGKLNASQFGGIKMWFDNTTNNIWQSILFDLFQIESTESKEDETKLVNYNQLLYHLCFNDQSHFGFEKIIAMVQNLNIIHDSKDFTNDELNTIKFRGTNVKLSDNDGQIQPMSHVNIISLKNNNEFIEAFNSVSVEHIINKQ